MPKRTKAHDPAQAKRAFLDSFRTSGNISLSSKATGVGRRTHYRWLDEDEAYGKDFADALNDAVDVLEAEATRRAVEGVRKPVGFHQGVPGAYVQEYSDTLLIFLLKGARPEKYRERFEHTGAGGGPVLFKSFVGVDTDAV